jgi:hypothetical protein
VGPTGVVCTPQHFFNCTLRPTGETRESRLASSIDHGFAIIFNFCPCIRFARLVTACCPTARLKHSNTMHKIPTVPKSPGRGCWVIVWPNINIAITAPWPLCTRIANKAPVPISVRHLHSSESGCPCRSLQRADSESGSSGFKWLAARGAVAGDVPRSLGLVAWANEGPWRLATQIPRPCRRKS